MTDPYSVLGIARGADEDTIKKAYRQKCKQYHPDLHPNDPQAEEQFKEVQSAYSEIMRERNGGGPGNGSYRTAGSSASGSSQRQGQYQDPFGFGFNPFGFGGYGYSSQGGYNRTQDSPEMQAANNYIRNGYYQEAMRVLNGISVSERNARWHYYCALANAGLGNNIAAETEARRAVEMEPNNYEYQNLLNRLQNPGRAYTSHQQSYSQPGASMGGNFCLQSILYLFFCNICGRCCCPGGFFFC